MRVVTTFITVITLTLLAGCSFLQTDDQPPEPTPSTISHPDLPDPIQSVGVNFIVISDKNIETIRQRVTTGNEVLIALDYEQSIRFRQYLEDIRRYTLESKSVICYYRDDLDERYCSGVDVDEKAD